MSLIRWALFVTGTAALFAALGSAVLYNRLDAALVCTVIAVPVLWMALRIYTWERR
ncbi:hypothetical protein ACIGO9_29680 [Nocardia asteroides]|uniref:hypothetical protein n=1 Tax=Nocardia asteroides TaxID=1824 RepID=UPI0037CCA23A